MSKEIKVEVYPGRYDIMEGQRAQDKEVELRCSACRAKTLHAILTSVVRADWGDEEQRVDLYQIAQCMGCKTLSFVHTPWRSDGYVLDPQTNNWEPTVDAHQYPGTAAAHHVLEGRASLPKKVLCIYDEAIFALNHDQRITSSTALRAVVEAACADKGIHRGTIESKIAQLAENGLVTQAGAERLHLVRLLSNDAMHEVKAHPAPTLIKMLLEVNHLLAELYVQPKEAPGLFEARG